MSDSGCSAIIGEAAYGILILSVTTSPFVSTKLH